MPHAPLVVAVVPARPTSARTARTRWRSGWPRTRARPCCRSARALRAVSCPGSCWRSRWSSPGPTRCPTFVFDEVDAGVGGKAAVEVGRRLARLARLAQVIVVTHLPQVAAFADAHLVIEKADDGSVTRSGLTRLDDAGRVTRAVPDAGWPGGLRVWPGARGGASGRGGGGTRRLRAGREIADGAQRRAAGRGGTLPCRAEAGPTGLPQAAGTRAAPMRRVAPWARLVWQDGGDGPVPQAPHEAPEQAR